MPDSYGYRPGKSAIDAVRTARQRCWRYDWVLDLDVKAFFDTIDWELMLTAVRQHTDCPWVLLYIERWLKAPVQMEDGSIVPRTAGTPQGGVISPLLANLFLHYVFDMWMTREFPHIPFERYADDAICHCQSAEEAQVLWSALRAALRPASWCCIRRRRRSSTARTRTGGATIPTSVRFPRLSVPSPEDDVGAWGKRIFAHGFLPAASPKALTRISRTVRRWALHHRSDKSLQELADMYNPSIRGWITYYSHFYRSAVASDPEEDRCLCHSMGTPQIQADGSSDQGCERLVRPAAPAKPKLFAHWPLCHGNGRTSGAV